MAPANPHGLETLAEGPLFTVVIPTFNRRDAVVEERHERIKEIFQPGTTRTIELNDGYAGPPFEKARLEIVAGEALLPSPN